MAIKGVNLTKRHRFVSDLDPEKGVDGAETVFYFRQLDSFQNAYISDQMMGFSQAQGGDAKVHMGLVSILTWKMSLVEVQNFLHPTTETPVELTTTKAIYNGKSYSVLTDDVISLIPEAVLQEGYVWLQEQNSMKAEEAKKSGPQSSGSNSSIGNVVAA